MAPGNDYLLLHDPYELVFRRPVASRDRHLGDSWAAPSMTLEDQVE
jgi:hypothetical protein